MAGSKRPSFLKRQKEQARLARAAEKREARRARKHAKASGLLPPADDMLDPLTGNGMDMEPEEGAEAPPEEEV